MFKVRFAASVLAASLATAGSTTAAVVLDQASIPETGAVDPTGTWSIDVFESHMDQTFTVGVAGILDHVDLDFESVRITSAVTGLEILGPGGASLFSSIISPDVANISEGAPYDFADIFSQDLRSANIHVGVGDVMTIRLTRIESDYKGHGLSWMLGYRLVGGSPVNLDYAGGELSRYLDPGGVFDPTLPELGVNDAAFRTYVDTGPGVPESTTWVMMVLGFGLLGGAVRRQRACPKEV